MAELNINTRQVRVYKDRFGFYETPELRTVSCDALTRDAEENLSTSVVEQECGGMVLSLGQPLRPTDPIIPGEYVATVKVQTPAGFMWVHTDDYSDLMDFCDSCCGS